MNEFVIYRQAWEVVRSRTLTTLDAVAQLPNPAAALGHRPGPGRAHIGWQLMHIAITDELFATERLVGTPPGYAELLPRFRGGSTPDDDIPTVEQIRDVLGQTRSHLLATLDTLGEADLDRVPPALKDRGWSVRRVLQVLTWHEAHHQGQAHLTLNLFKASGV